jgi:chemotaxis protein MotA
MNSPALLKLRGSRDRSVSKKVEIEDPFTEGVRFVADGYDGNFIRDNLERDRDNFLTHFDEGQKIYRAVGDCAPAFGMIGTLIGMVQMFANMTDPSKLGPFMAVALLATFYGSVVANLLCLPIADKLHLKLVDEEINRTLIIDGILMIREGKSPTLVREMLLAYLPEKHRHTEEEGNADEGAEAVPA